MKAFLAFHGTRMYKDAGGLRFYEQTGELPMVTSSTGLDSLKEVLKEDVRLPATREELLMEQGWKVIDLSISNRRHASTLLREIPEGEGHSVGQILQALEKDRCCTESAGWTWLEAGSLRQVYLWTARARPRVSAFISVVSGIDTSIRITRNASMDYWFLCRRWPAYLCLDLKVAIAVCSVVPDPSPFNIDMAEETEWSDPPPKLMLSALVVLAYLRPLFVLSLQYS